MNIKKISTSKNPGLYRNKVAFVLVCVGRIHPDWIKQVYPRINHLKDYLYIFIYPRMHFHPDYVFLQHFNIESGVSFEELEKLYGLLDLNIYFVDETQHSQFAAFIDGVQYVNAEWGVFLHDDMYVAPAYLDGIDFIFDGGYDRNRIMLTSNLVEPFGCVPYQNEVPFKDEYERIILPKDLEDARLKIDHLYSRYCGAVYVETFTTEDWRSVIKSGEWFMNWFDFDKFDYYARYVFEYFTEKVELFNVKPIMHLDGGHLIRANVLAKVRKYYDHFPAHTETFFLALCRNLSWRFTALPFLTYAHMLNPYRIYTLRRTHMEFYVWKYMQENLGNIIAELRDEKL